MKESTAGNVLVALTFTLLSFFTVTTALGVDPTNNQPTNNEPSLHGSQRLSLDR